MERLCSCKADFERIKSAFAIYRTSKFREISECYKSCSEAKKISYFNKKYVAHQFRHGHDFRIVYAGIQTYSFGYIFSDPENNDIFCYVLPSREICEYISILSGSESEE